MHFDSLILMVAGAIGGVFGLAALVTGVHGVAAVLCAFVFAIAAACLFAGWRFHSVSPLARHRRRQVVAEPRERRP